MDPWILFRWPLLWLRFWQKRVGWKPIIIGWVLSIIGILIYEFVT